MSQLISLLEGRLVMRYDSAKKNLQKWGTSGPLRDRVLSQIFGQIPLVEAKANMLITPMPEDEGDPNNPWCCRIANAAKRMFGCTHALVVGSMGYFDLPDGKGGRELNRFILSREAIKTVHANDAGKNSTVPQTIVLLAPTKGQTLKVKRERDRQRRIRQNRQKEYATRKPTRGHGAKLNLVRIATARTAAGIRTKGHASI